MKPKIIKISSAILPLVIDHSVTLDYEFNDKWQNAWYNDFIE